MALYVATKTTDIGGRRINKGDVVEDDNDLYVLSPASFTLASGSSDAVTGPGGVIGAVTGASTSWNIGSSPGCFDCTPNGSAVTLTISGFTDDVAVAGVVFLRPTSSGTLTVAVSGGTVTPSTYAYTSGTPVLLTVFSSDGGVTVDLGVPVTGLTFGALVTGATNSVGVGAGTTGDTTAQAAIGSNGVYLGPGGSTAPTKSLYWNANIGFGIGGPELSNMKVASGSRFAVSCDVSLGGLNSSCALGAINASWHTLLVQSTGDGGSGADPIVLLNNAANAEVWGVNRAGRIRYITGNTQTTVGAAGGASALPATPTGYMLMLVGASLDGTGGTSVAVPYYAAS